MNDHDDEVTTDVDPAWIAAIRAEAASVSPDGTSPDATSTPGTSGAARRPEPTDRTGDEDWFDDDVQWDAEATVGVSSGLIDRIRAEIDNDRGRGVVPPSPAFEPPQATEAPAAGNVTEATPLVPPVVPPPPSPTPPAAPIAAPPTPAPVERPIPITAGEEAASTTVRWEPRQRLAMTAPVKESAAIVDHSRHTGLDRTKVAIAVIVAVTVLLVVWLVSRAGGSDDPAPVGTVPAVSTPTVPPDGPDGAGAGG